jgi:hypothetical protein
MKRLAALIAVLSLLMAGCRAEVRLLLDINDDGSGTLAAEVGINNQLKDLIDQLTGDSDSIISALDLGLNGDRSTRVEGDMTIYTTQVSFDDETKIPDAAAGHFTTFKLDMNNAGTRLEANLDLVGDLDLSQFPVNPSSIDPSTFSAHILVSLPGEVGDNNADEITPDGQFSWTIPLDGKLYMYASTTYPRGGFPSWLVMLLILSVGLAGGVWLAAVRRDKKNAATQREAPQPPPVAGPDLELPLGEKPSNSPFFDLDE